MNARHFTVAHIGCVDAISLKAWRHCVMHQWALHAGTGSLTHIDERRVAFDALHAIKTAATSKTSSRCSSC
jgi:hypothetical protein